MKRILRTRNLILFVLGSLVWMLLINSYIPHLAADSDLPPPAEMTAVVSTPIAEPLPAPPPEVEVPPSTIQTWQGLTDQGEPITIHIDGDSIILLRVGLRVFSDTCSSRYTSVHSGFLGYVFGDQFRVVVDTEREFLIVEGSLGDNPGGTLTFSPGAVSNVCGATVHTRWFIPWQSRPPAPPYGHARSNYPPSPPQTPLPTLTPTPTPRHDPTGHNWDGVLEPFRPTSPPPPPSPPPTATP